MVPASTKPTTALPRAVFLSTRTPVESVTTIPLPAKSVTTQFLIVTPLDP